MEFFGVERVLCATDMPFDPGQGPDYIRSMLADVQSMDVTGHDRALTLAENARGFFRLRQ